jgi:predicted GH43/DUF377 family glycosyl hydrolase
MPAPLRSRFCGFSSKGCGSPQNRDCKGAGRVKLATSLVRRWPVLLLAAFTASCGRYADFTLPPPEASGPSGPFRWEAQASPVLARGNAGDWDSTDVLNPSVIRWRDAYLNLYSGFDGKTWHTGMAQSSDGVLWNKQGRILSPEGWEGTYIAANGSALEFAGSLLYWYQAGDPPRIALATSGDGKSWQRRGQVVPLGPRGSFDEMGVADPDVIRRGADLYLIYLGQDRARRQRLGVARSRDGVVWEKLRTNPVLELGPPGSFDENGLGEPAVWTSGGSYWMLYTGRDHAERRGMGLARSVDGVNWKRDPGFSPVGGGETWDSAVVCDPSVEVSGDEVRVWFGGGDVPAPDHGIHGQIGIGVLKPSLPAAAPGR